jgi:hypothetical protein
LKAAVKPKAAPKAKAPAKPKAAAAAKGKKKAAPLEEVDMNEGEATAEEGEVRLYSLFSNSCVDLQLHTGGRRGRGAAEEEDPCCQG